VPINQARDLFTCRAELHIHTVLSPCAAVEMIPPLIIQTAEEKGINLIAITDHNAIGNVKAVMQAAIDSPVHVLPGIELQTREEIHSICLFDRYENLAAFFSEIQDSFPKTPNNPDFFGEQFLVDATGEFIRREKRLLSTSSNLTLKDSWELVGKHQGLLIPAHVNRKLFGLFPVLGFAPQDIDVIIMEISRHLPPTQAIAQFPQLCKYKIIQSGDAHQLDEIIGCNQFTIKDYSLKEIIFALKGMKGRKYQNTLHTFPS